MTDKQLGIDRHPLMVNPAALLKDVIAQMSPPSITCAVSCAVTGNVVTTGPALTADSPPKHQRRSYALVTQNQALLGIITERDIVKLTAEGVCFASTTVQMVMTKNVVTMPAATVKDAFTPLTLMRQHRIRHLPIVDEQNNVCGVATSATLRETLPASALFQRRRVQDVMTTELITAPPETPVIDIAKLMALHRVSCVIIQASNTTPPQGIITEYDIVQVQRLTLNMSTLAVETIMSWPLICLHLEDSLLDVQQKMQALHVRRLVVADDQGLLIGLVTQSSILSVIDPYEMATTIELLQQQVNRLQDERVRLLQARNTVLEAQVQTGETSLLVCQEKFRATFEQAAVGIAHLSLDGKFIALNQRFGEILGYQPADLLYRSFIEVTHPEEQAIGREAIEQLIRGTQSSFSQEKRYYRQDGTILWGNITVSIATQPSGAPDYFLAVLEDICDRKQAEADLQQLNHELENRIEQRARDCMVSERRYRMLFESAPDLLFVLNIQGEIQQINSVVTQRLGYTDDELKGKVLSDFSSPFCHHNYQESFQTLLKQGMYRQELALLSRTGNTLWVESASSVISDLAGQAPYILVVQRDITDRKRLETRLRSSERQMRTVFEAMHDIVLVCQMQANNMINIDIAPTTPQETKTKESNQNTGSLATHTVQFIWDNEHNAAGQYIQQVIATQTAVKYDYSCLVDGRELHFLANISPMSDNTVLWVARDISDRKHAEQALFQEKELAQVTLQSIGDAVITTDIHGNIYKFNPVAEQLTGWETAEAQGRPISEVFNIIHEETRQPVENPIQRALREDQTVGLTTHTVLIARDKAEYSIEDSAAPIRDRNGQVIGAVMVFHDVTHARNLTRQLSWQASHDPLTRLINRRKFDQVLLDALQTARQHNHHHVLCFLDLDQFKIINDTCGHAAGDELLCQISKLFQQFIRTNDTIARLGGDEFAILLHDCPLERAIVIAEELRQATQTFRFPWMEKLFSVGVSVGLVKLDKASPDLASVIGAADAACYAAKTKGRNRIQVYGVNDEALIQQRGEQWWSVRIKQAIEENRLCLYSQAIVPTAEGTGGTGGAFEILLRMIDEQGQVVTASEFIPAAERYNLISEIDRWVVQKFLQDYCLHPPNLQASKPLAQYMINLSGASVGDEQFLDFLRAQLGQHPEIAKHICFEITETAAISNLNQAVCFIEELKLLGCQFAIDDFGSGMASFAYLKTLPVDYLKIDGRFVEEMADDPATSAIVESINHIGHVMGMRTIAEFVSSQLIRDRLKQIGVDYVQGFEISRPCALAFYA
ncbi:MAG: PAS domain S-box protein [Cyanobacteria bacterium J06598_3]